MSSGIGMEESFLLRMSAGWPVVSGGNRSIAGDVVGQTARMAAALAASFTVPTRHLPKALRGTSGALSSSSLGAAAHPVAAGNQVHVGTHSSLKRHSRGPVHLTPTLRREVAADR